MTNYKVLPVRMDKPVFQALESLARTEKRLVRLQATWIIEQELLRRGLLPLPTGQVEVKPEVTNDES